MLELAKEVVEAEKQTDPVEERDRAKEALTELFNEAKTKNTHIIVERIVADIDDIVKKVRFPDWQQTRARASAQVQQAATPDPPEIQITHRPRPVRQSLRLHPAVLLRNS